MSAMMQFVLRDRVYEVVGRLAEVNASTRFADVPEHWKSEDTAEEDPERWDGQS